MKFLNGIGLTVALILSIPGLVLAKEQGDIHPYLNNKFFVDVGVFFPDRKVKLRVDGALSGPSDPVDFEKETGNRKSDETFSLNFGWRFGEKWELGGQYFASSGVRQAALQEDIEWNDVIFEQGSSVTAGQDFSLTRIFFARRFESSEQHEFGVGAGLHWLEFGGFIEGNIDIGGGGNAFRRESVSASAPLPNIGVWYMYSMSQKWALKSRLDWFGASFGDYDGTLINAALGVNYQVLEHAGIGLHYNLFDLDVGVKKSDWRGDAEMIYEGIYVNLSFYW